MALQQASGVYITAPRLCPRRPVPTPGAAGCGSTATATRRALCADDRRRRMDSWPAWTRTGRRCCSGSAARPTDRRKSDSRPVVSPGLHAQRQYISRYVDGSEVLSQTTANSSTAAAYIQGSDGARYVNAPHADTLVANAAYDQATVQAEMAAPWVRGRTHLRRGVLAADEATSTTRAGNAPPADRQRDDRWVSGLGRTWAAVENVADSGQRRQRAGCCSTRPDVMHQAGAGLCQAATLTQMDTGSGADAPAALLASLGLSDGAGADALSALSPRRSPWLKQVGNRPAHRRRALSPDSGGGQTRLRCQPRRLSRCLTGQRTGRLLRCWPRRPVRQRQGSDAIGRIAASLPARHRRGADAPTNLAAALAVLDSGAGRQPEHRRHTGNLRIQAQRRRTAFWRLCWRRVADASLDWTAWSAPPRDRIRGQRPDSGVGEALVVQWPGARRRQWGRCVGAADGIP